MIASENRLKKFTLASFTKKPLAVTINKQINKCLISYRVRMSENVLCLRIKIISEISESREFRFEDRLKRKYHTSLTP